MRIHLCTAYWPEFSPSRYARRKTKLNQNLWYRRTSNVCISDRQCLAANHPAVLIPILLRLCHCLLIAGHPGERQMNNKIRRDLYWPHMDFLDHCSYVVTDILGSLPKTKSGNKFIVLMTDRYSKLTKTLPIARTTATAVAKIIVYHFKSISGVLSTIVTDNVPQFTSKLFQAVRAELRITSLTVTE